MILQWCLFHIFIFSVNTLIGKKVLRSLRTSNLKSFLIKSKEKRFVAVFLGVSFVCSLENVLIFITPPPPPLKKISEYDPAVLCICMMYCCCALKQDEPTIPIRREGQRRERARPLWILGPGRKNASLQLQLSPGTRVSRGKSRIPRIITRSYSKSTTICSELLSGSAVRSRTQLVGLRGESSPYTLLAPSTNNKKNSTSQFFVFPADQYVTNNIIAPPPNNLIF